MIASPTIRRRTLQALLATLPLLGCAEDVLRALQEDPATQVILLVSKPPGRAVAGRILAQAGMGSKPTVICFLGAPPFDPSMLPRQIIQAHTLEEAALHAARLAGQLPGAESPLPPVGELLRQQERRLGIKVGPLAGALRPGQKYHHFTVYRFAVK